MSTKDDEEKEREKKRKKDIDIAFKASKYVEKSSKNDDEELDYDDVEHLIKRFCKFLNKEREAKKAIKRNS